MPSLLVFEENSLKKITILVFILSWTVFKPILKSTLKEEFAITKQLSVTMEEIVFPLTLISKVTVKFI
mgnify:CR=1 FL=1